MNTNSLTYLLTKETNLHCMCRHVQGRLQRNREEGKRRHSLCMLNCIYFTNNYYYFTNDMDDVSKSQVCSKMMIACKKIIYD